MSWAFPRGHDCFINSYQNLNYPFIAAAQHCCFFQHSFDYILYWYFVLKLNLASSLLMITFSRKRWNCTGLGLGNLGKIASHRWAPSDSEKVGWGTRLCNGWAHPPRSLVSDFNLVCLSKAQPLPNEQVQIWFLSLFVFSFFVLFYSLQGSLRVQLTSAKWDWLTSTKITHCLSVHSSFSLISIFEVFVPFHGLLSFKRQLSPIVIRVNWLKGHH